MLEVNSNNGGHNYSYKGIYEKKVDRITFLLFSILLDRRKAEWHFGE